MRYALQLMVARAFSSTLAIKRFATFLDKPKIWYRFVDDVLSIVKVATLDKLLTHLNSQHPTIEFTVEREKNHELPFMDVRINRNTETLNIAIYGTVNPHTLDAICSSRLIIRKSLNDLE